MNDVKDKFPKTYEAIMNSFSGESMARNRYDYFAKVAKKEGNHKLADFFEETARNEQMHAKLLFRLVNGISDSKTNIAKCIEDEKEEHSSMYPGFAKIAEEEGFEAAKELFEKLAKIEKDHEERFKRLLGELENDTFKESKTGEPIAWICRVCGNIETAVTAPDECPVCSHPQGHFERMQKEY